MTNKQESIKSKRQIIKSTGIVGSSQVFTTALHIVKTKIIALLLGTTGVGLLASITLALILLRWFGLEGLV